MDLSAKAADWYSPNRTSPDLFYPNPGEQKLLVDALTGGKTMDLALKRTFDCHNLSRCLPTKFVLVAGHLEKIKVVDRFVDL